MPKARRVDVVISDEGDLVIDGLGVIDNPFKEVEFPAIDKGELWFRLWSEDLHNNPNTGRIRAILLNMMSASVSVVIGEMLKQSNEED